MNPFGQQATGPPQAASSNFSPYSSPLHPTSLQHNNQILSSLATLAACFSGLVAGILGLTNFSGFILYLLSAISSALIVAVLKCDFDIVKYVPQAHGIGAAPGPGGISPGKVKSWKGWMGLVGIGQENFLGFLLFWIGSYALIHGMLYLFLMLGDKVLMTVYD